MSSTDAYRSLLEFAVSESDRFVDLDDRFILPGNAVADELVVDNYEDWIRLIPGWTTLASWHHRLWQWAWEIESGVGSRHFVAIAARGGGKSSNVEYVTCMLGARRLRKYALYVRATQAQANSSVANIANILESSRISQYYPQMAQRKIGKYGSSKGWTRSMIRTATGFTVVAYGLDSAIRGTKIDDFRPDLIILDDIDSKHDTRATTRRKIDIITTSILPAGSPDMVVMAVQNLIISDGVFAQLASDTPPFLTDRVLSGPHPAVLGLKWRMGDKGPEIIGGVPVWAGQSIEVCQDQMRTWGVRAFLAEAQHDTEQGSDGIFSDIEFERIEMSEVPRLEKIVCWIDPAVTSSKKSHNQAIMIDGLEDKDGLAKEQLQRIFRLYSWEGIDSPSAVISRALRMANKYGASSIGFETNMGGDLWRSTYDSISQDMFAREEIERIPTFKSERATGATGGKEERTDQMYDEYVRGLIVHVTGEIDMLESALRRFPGQPDDLVDAAYWSWVELYKLALRRMSRKSFRLSSGNVAKLMGGSSQGKQAAIQQMDRIKRRLGLRMK